MLEIRVLRHPYLNIYVNSFVLPGQDGAVFIDSGLNGNAHLLAPFMNEGKALIATHGHWDHIGLHSYLVEKGAALYAHKGDRKYLENHPWHWQDLFGQYREDFDLPPARETVFRDSVGGQASIDCEITDGQKLSLYGRTLTVYHTPGHSDGSVCLLEEQTGALFTGDSLMGKGFFTGLPQYTDPTAYRASMQRLKGLSADTVYSCHNEPMAGNLLANKAQDGIDTTNQTEAAVKQYLEKTKNPVLRDLTAFVCTKLGKTVGGGACVTVMAHLQELAEEYPQVLPILKSHEEAMQHV